MIPCQRHLFDIPETVTYLNCAFTAPLMHKAVAAGREALMQKSNPWTIASHQFFKNPEKIRRLFGQLIGSSPDNIAIIPAVSYGIAIAAKNIPIAKDQTLIVVENQFPSNIYSWRRLAMETGAEIVTVHRPPDNDLTSAVLEKIDRKTAIAALPNCHWTDGAFIDLVKIGKRCRDVGAALVVDGIQSLGAMPFRIEEVQPDFLITSSHKWLLGPYSFGFCYISPYWHYGAPLEENWLNRSGSENFARLVDYQDEYQSGARRFDVGAVSNFILAPIAAAALEQILEWKVVHIAQTLQCLTRHIAERAVSAGFQVCSEANRAPHMLGLSIAKGLPENLPLMLAKENVFVSVRGNSIRIAPHVYNTLEDIERLFSVLSKAGIG